MFRLERLSQKLTRLREAGVERIYMPRFDARFAARTADEFLTMVLGQSLGANVVVTGEDFAFGKARGGTSETLRAWGAERRVAVHSVPPVVAAGERCSSTAIRRALEAGDMGHAGRPAWPVIHDNWAGSAWGWARRDHRFSHGESGFAAAAETSDTRRLCDTCPACGKNV